MSNINIKRAIQNIRTNTTLYTPVIEVVVNAIQAIDESGREDGRVLIRAERASQQKLDGGLRDIVGFEVEDNGVGFTDAHRDSFDTLYTDHRISEGGKGFGRFTCLKYFDAIRIRSVYREKGEPKCRRFSMGREWDIIVSEQVTDSESEDTGTLVHLSNLRGRQPYEKKLPTIARNLVERLLPYFIRADYRCPSITLSESDGNNPVLLNDFVDNELSTFIREIPVDNDTFTLRALEQGENFLVRVFKLYAPKKQKSRLSLVAHKREVLGSTLDRYIPEFETDFYDETKDGTSDRNYIVKAYVFGSYLDRNVSLERGGFEFGMNSDMFHGIAQSQIEKKAAEIAREAVGVHISLRQDRKRERVLSYVEDDAPWHKELLGSVDLSELAYQPTNEDIEVVLQKEKFSRERAIKREVNELLEATDFDDVGESAADIVNRVSGSSKNDLIHYVATRRTILDIFAKSLQLKPTGKYSSEGVVHDIIFPRQGDSESTPFRNHNLWILDERLNFTSYVSSDRPLDRAESGRPDLLVFNRRVLFRGENEASNPVTVFEFKRPQRDDFVDPASDEDPVQQIVRYVNAIRDGRYKTPEGRKILVAESTPFYGFVVCDLTPKVEQWLDREKDFTPMPDRLGWFQWMGNINLYVEVISWDKVLRDAGIRNKVFFDKLGI